MTDQNKEDPVSHVFTYLSQAKIASFIRTSVFIGVWGIMGLLGYDLYKSSQDQNGIINRVLQEYFESNKDHVDQYFEMQRISTGLLRELRIESGAQYAVLFLFHNGSASIGNVPFLSATAFAEDKYSSLPSLSDFLQDLSLERIYRLNRTLAGQYLYFTEDFSEVSDRSSLYQTACSGPCLAVFRGPIIRTLDGRPHGFISLLWAEDGYPSTDNEDFLEALGVNVDRASTILQGAFHVLEFPNDFFPDVSP